MEGKHQIHTAVHLTTIHVYVKTHFLISDRHMVPDCFSYKSEKSHMACEHCPSGRLFIIFIFYDLMKLKIHQEQF